MLTSGSNIAIGLFELTSFPLDSFVSLGLENGFSIACDVFVN